jgi:hypothetical protein
MVVVTLAPSANEVAEVAEAEPVGAVTSVPVVAVAPAVESAVASGIVPVAVLVVEPVSGWAEAGGVALDDEVDVESCWA